MQSLHTSAAFRAWAEHEGIDLSMLYERLQLTPDGALAAPPDGAGAG
jgi:hypothetical protein